MVMSFLSPLARALLDKKINKLIKKNNNNIIKRKLPQILIIFLITNFSLYLSIYLYKARKFSERETHLFLITTSEGENKLMSWIMWSHKTNLTREFIWIIASTRKEKRTQRSENFLKETHIYSLLPLLKKRIHIYIFISRSPHLFYNLIMLLHSHYPKPKTAKYMEIRSQVIHNSSQRLKKHAIP